MLLVIIFSYHSKRHGFKVIGLQRLEAISQKSCQTDSSSWMNWLSSNVNTVDRYASIEKVFTKVKLTINNAFVLRLLDMGMKMLRMIMMLGVDVLPDKILGFTRWWISLRNGNGLRWSVGPMDKASASRAGDSRFESWADQYASPRGVFEFRMPNTTDGQELFEKTLHCRILLQEALAGD